MQKDKDEEHDDLLKPDEPPRLSDDFPDDIDELPQQTREDFD
jgi:hypothetical protein